MKTLKNSIAILLIAFISMSVNAQVDNSLSFSLNTNSLFRTGSADLKDEGITTLKGIAKQINSINNGTIIIEGHTDDMGSSNSNQILSERRANSVADLLKMNVNSSSFKWTVNGYGESKPKVDNSTSENRKINRRIDIYVNSDSEITLRVEIDPSIKPSVSSSNKSSHLELPQKDNAKWKQMQKVFTELANLNDAGFKKLKGRKLPEKLKYISYGYDLNKNRYALSKPMKLDLFKDGTFKYLYRETHSEAIYFEDLTFFNDKKNDFRDKYYDTTMENMMTIILGNEYVIFKGEDAKNECVYGYSEGYNIVWKHKSEVGERELKKKFVRFNYHVKFKKVSKYDTHTTPFYEIRIYFYNVYPNINLHKTKKKSTSRKIIDPTNIKKHKEYYDNGNIKKEGQYDSNGKATGIWIYYDKNELLPQVGYYNNGKEQRFSIGCLSGDCENGYGLKYTGGLYQSIQLGNFTNGKLNGIATQQQVIINTINMTTDYRGLFKNGKYHGKGVLKTYDTDKSITTYQGGFNEGKRDGYGVESNSKGRYEGYWKNDKEHGKAKIYDSSGKLLFDGEFENGDPKK